MKLSGDTGDWRERSHLIDIEEEYGHYVENVFRTVREIGDLVLSEYADERLWSEYVAWMVHEALDEVRNEKRRAVETTLKGGHIEDGPVTGY